MFGFFGKQQTKETEMFRDCSAFQTLEKHALEVKKTHLRDLLQDETRCKQLLTVQEGIYMDYARQRVETKTMDLLHRIFMDYLN